MNRLRRRRIGLASVAHLDGSVADRNFRVHDRAVRCQHPHLLRALERCLQELDELLCAPYDDVRCDRRQSRPQIGKCTVLRCSLSRCRSGAFVHDWSPLQVQSTSKTPFDVQKKYATHSLSPVDRLKERMTSPKSEVLQGTLDLLVLKTLDSMGPMHGF